MNLNFILSNMFFGLHENVEIYNKEMRSHYKQATIDAKPDIDFNGDLKLFITILFTIIGL